MTPAGATLSRVALDALAADGDATEAFAEHTTALHLSGRDGVLLGATLQVDAGIATGAPGGAAGGRWRACPLATERSDALRPELAAAERAAARALLDAAVATARADPAVIRAEATLTVTRRRHAVAGRDGLLVADTARWLELHVEVRAERGVRHAAASASGGSRRRAAAIDPGWAQALGTLAARRARLAFDALPPPAGDVAVVLQGSAAGAWLHEACGHALEADLVARGESPLAGRLGERIAPRAVTVVDDGGVPGLGGSLRVDDEGSPARATTLIERGVARELIVDRAAAARGLGSLAGNGRRASYRHPPLPRMTNTYLAAGDIAPGDLLASLRPGVLCRVLHVADWDRRRGEVAFHVAEAWRVERGALDAPLQPLRLVGRAAGLLPGVSGVADDLNFSGEVHVCTKAGQIVPIGVGAPSLRVEGLRVEPIRRV